MQTLKKEYMVDKTRIGFIRFIFEAHDGIAVVSTLDAKAGHILLTIAPDCLDTVNTVIDDLKKDFLFDEC